MRFPTLDQQECRRPIILLHLRAAECWLDLQPKADRDISTSTTD